MPDELTRAGRSFADVLRFQEETGEFAALSETERADLPIRSAGSTLCTDKRRRPNGRVLEIRTAPLPDGGFVDAYNYARRRKTLKGPTP